MQPHANTCIIAYVGSSTTWIYRTMTKVNLVETEYQLQAINSNQICFSRQLIYHNKKKTLDVVLICLFTFDPVNYNALTIRHICIVQAILHILDLLDQSMMQKLAWKQILSRLDYCTFLYCTLCHNGVELQHLYRLIALVANQWCDARPLLTNYTGFQWRVSFVSNSRCWAKTFCCTYG